MPTLTTELSILSLDDFRVPAIILTFDGPEGARAVSAFSPEDKLLLADAAGEPGRYSISDIDGHEFATIPRDDRWTDTAEQAGFFILVFKTPLPESALTGGRVLVVSFPFGKIMQDTSTFSVDGEVPIEHSTGMERLVGALRTKAKDAVKRVKRQIPLAN